MANFYRVGKKFINFDLVTDVQQDRRTPGRIAIALAGPQPASVGSSDWTVESRVIVLDGMEAAAVITHLEMAAIELIR